jgi:hypothetical protein
MASDATTTTGSILAGGRVDGGPGPADPAQPSSAVAGGRPSAEKSGELAGRRLAGLAGGVALAGMILASLAIVGITAARPSILSPPSLIEFPRWMAGPLGWIGRPVKLGQNGLKLTLSLAVGGMFVAYLTVLACVRRLRAGWVIGSIVGLHVIFVLSPPLSLTDAFNYLNYGRLEALHGLNPYTTIPALGPTSDPTFYLSNWHQLLSPYGPLFTIFSFVLVPLGVAGGFWALKASLMIASLATLWLVWRCAELVDRDPLKATAFVGLNPLVLVWGLGGDHNDFFMVFLVMLACYLLLRARAVRAGLESPPAAAAGGGGGQASRRTRLVAFLDGGPRPRPGEAGPAWELGAGFALVAAVAIKASAGILLPVVLLGATRRFRLLGGMLAAAVVFGGASILAFGPHVPNLAQQSTLVTLAGLPNVVGSIIGLGGETDSMKTALAGLLVLGAVLGAVWSWRTRRWIEASGFVTLVLLVTLSWALPWYVLWLLPLAGLARGRGLRVAALVVSVYLLVIWMPNMTAVIHALHYKPSLTRLGQERQQKTLLLLH